MSTQNEVIELVPESTRGHLDNAEAAIERARQRISESSILRARVLDVRVSGRMSIAPVVSVPAAKSK